MVRTSLICQPIAYHLVPQFTFYTLSSDVFHIIASIIINCLLRFQSVDPLHSIGRTPGSHCVSGHASVGGPGSKSAVVIGRRWCQGVPDQLQFSGQCSSSLPVLLRHCRSYHHVSHLDQLESVYSGAKEKQVTVCAVCRTCSSKQNPKWVELLGPMQRRYLNILPNCVDFTTNLLENRGG